MVVDNNSEYGKALQKCWAEIDEAVQIAFKKMQDISIKFEPVCEECGTQPDWMVVDWCIVTGLVAFDKDGDRIGQTHMLVKGGDQPKYITDGLLLAGGDHAEEIRELNYGSHPCRGHDD